MLVFLIIFLAITIILWKMLLLGTTESWEEIPVLETEDREMFKSYLEKGTSCFEFGSGWGTIWIAKLPNIKKIKSIENDIVWYEKIQKKIDEEKLENIVELCYIDTDSDHSSWGHPKSRDLTKWKKYYTSYNPEFNADIILIDSRFRVNCGLDLIKKIDMTTFVMIDDFNNRPGYHVLLKYYDIVECGKIAVILKKKLLINEDELSSDIFKYETDAS